MKYLKAALSLLYYIFLAVALPDKLKAENDKTNTEEA